MSRRGGGKRPGDVNVEMSKFLAYVLRHGANKHGLSMRADGYVLVEELLALDRFKRWDGVTVDTIRHLVRHLVVSLVVVYQDVMAFCVIGGGVQVAVDSKQRYSLVTEEGQLLIRANQGHSLRGKGLAKPLTLKGQSWYVATDTYATTSHSLELMH